jgi:predicted Rossmann fold flavoprotein
MSGPAVLKLSAWAARELHDAHYQATLRVNWLFDAKADDVRQAMNGLKMEHAKKSVESVCPWPIPKRIWKSLVAHCGATDTRWAELPKKVQQKLISELVSGEFQVRGKGQFKEEFVTCGGVKLSEVDFRTMESRLVPGLFFAGEVLDVDAVTGGFNFQNAWTTGWIAGNAV